MQNTYGRKVLAYRKCVGMLLFNEKGQVFLGKRRNSMANVWQMPQGGIERDETVGQAALRELKEEVGTDKAVISAEYPGWLCYDIPPDLLPSSVMRRKFKGQRQRWLYIKFEGSAEDICLETEHPEFTDWRWEGDMDIIVESVIYFKRQVYRKVLGYYAQHVRPKFCE